MEAIDIEARWRACITAGWTGDFEAGYACYSPECVFHRPPWPDMAGVEVDKAHFRKMLATYTEMRLTITALLAKDNWAAALWSWSGFEAGKEVTLSGASFSRWEDGRIVEVWDYPDNLGFMQQRGLIPGFGG